MKVPKEIKELLSSGEETKSCDEDEYSFHGSGSNSKKERALCSISTCHGFVDRSGTRLAFERAHPLHLIARMLTCIAESPEVI